MTFNIGDFVEFHPVDESHAAKHGALGVVTNLPDTYDMIGIRWIQDPRWNKQMDGRYISSNFTVVAVAVAPKDTHKVTIGNDDFMAKSWDEVIEILSGDIGDKFTYIVPL